MKCFQFNSVILIVTIVLVSLLNDIIITALLLAQTSSQTINLKLPQIKSGSIDSDHLPCVC
jgi:hypothetical protein